MHRALGRNEFADSVVLVVHAHPDDEVFATGAATIAANAFGAKVHLRLFTGGEGRATGLRDPDLTEARQRKEKRLAASTTLLGIDDWAYLTEPGRWTDTPHAPERTIANASLGELVEPVMKAIETVRPDVLLTVGEDGLTGHPDHIACHHAVRLAHVQSAHRPRTALAAVLDRRAVVLAYRSASATLGRSVGSGRVTGTALDTAVVTAVGPSGTEQRRRQALDEYLPSLGTAAAGDLQAERVGSGDSALLRFVLDASGWDRDRFVRLT